MDEDGIQERMFMVQGDIEISEKELMADSDDAVIDKQFASWYRIDANKYRTIRIVVHTGKTYNFAFRSKERGLVRVKRKRLSNNSINQLKKVIDIYNSLNIKLTFKLVYSNKKKTNGAITVQTELGNNLYQGNQRLDYAGRATFPKRDGKPGSLIIINKIADQNNGVVTNGNLQLLLAHEIGHALGLRHTDRKTRASCLRPNNNEEDGPGVIPGTPTNGNDSTSTMNACFDTNSTKGKILNDNDRKALRYLYPR